MLEETAEAFLFGERGRFAPPGVAGGEAGACNRFRYPQDGGPQNDGPQDGCEAEPPFASKMVGIKLARGQRLRLETPGGGGYGAPFERDPAAVAEDVRLGYVGAEAAARDYGVALDDAGAVDEAATRDLREAAE